MKHDKVLFIIDKLALDHEVHSSRIDCVVATNYTIQISESSPAGYIAFAAYAKAAMAKRGWTITPINDKRGHWALSKWCMRAWRGAGDVVYLYNDYDPTDPISEANALIDAIYAALEIETTT